MGPTRGRGHAGRHWTVPVLLAVVAASLSLATGASPAQAATGRAYIPDGGSDTVAVVDTSSNALVAVIPVGDRPNAVAVLPDGTRVYVTNFGSDAVSVIDTATNAVIATVPVGNGPEGVAVRPDGARVYVTTYDGLAVIDTATNTVVATIPIVAGAGMDFSPDGSRLYVANMALDAVTVVDTATNTVLADIPVGHTPFDVVARPDGARVYVSNQSSDTISVIDTATNTVVATVPVPGGPSGMDIGPDGRRLYVASLTGFVSVIDTSANAVVATVTVPFARGLDVAPSGDRVYVTNEMEGFLVVLDPTTGAVVGSVQVGVYPADVEVAVPPATPRPVVAGSTWFSDGTKVRSGPPGSAVTARATGAIPNLSYRLVLATNGCGNVIAVLNPTAVVAGSSGLIGRVQGTVPATTAPGVYEVCFREVGGTTATGIATLTVG